MADEPERKKVTLAWNGEDVAACHGLAVREGRRRPSTSTSRCRTTRPGRNDKVLHDGEIGRRLDVLGLQLQRALVPLARRWSTSTSSIGTEVTLVWGEEGGGSSKPVVERHRQAEIRVDREPVSLLRGRAHLVPRGLAYEGRRRLSLPRVSGDRRSRSAPGCRSAAPRGAAASRRRSCSARKPRASRRRYASSRPVFTPATSGRVLTPLRTPRTRRGDARTALPHVAGANGRELDVAGVTARLAPGAAVTHGHPLQRPVAAQREPCRRFPARSRRGSRDRGRARRISRRSARGSRRGRGRGGP